MPRRSWTAVVVVACLLVPLAAAAPAGPPTFGAAKDVLSFSGDVVGGLSEIETGDVNGDGIADVVGTRLAFPVAHKTFPVGIFLGDGKGGFVDGSSLWDGAPAETEHGRQILIADFNGDHRNDIFVADHGYDAEPFPGHRNTLILSTPQGKLVDASGNLPPESGFAHSAAVAHVNHDGSLDIYAGNLCCGDHTPPEILLNDGTGHFTRRLDLLPPDLQDTNNYVYTRSVFLDANGDGAPDLVLGAANQTADSTVLLNDGSGHFRFGPALPPKPFGSRSILISFATLDVNGDGKTDLLAGFQHEDFSGRRIQVLISGGDGSFRDETAARLPAQDEGQGWPYAIRVADVNGDGSLDFAVSLHQGGNERGPLYLNDGTGVLHQTSLPATSDTFLFLDANNDGHVDIFDSFPGGPGGTERHQVQLQLVRVAAPPAVRLRVLKDRLRVTWAAVTGASSYEVWRNGKRVATVTATQFDDRRAAKRVKYAYRVRAVNELGPGDFSSTVTGRRR